MSMRHTLQQGTVTLATLAFTASMLAGCDPKTPAPKAQAAATQTTTTTTTTVVERSTTPVAAVSPQPSMTTSTVAAAPPVPDGPTQPAWQPVPSKATAAPAAPTVHAQARPAPSRTLGEISHIEPIHERPQGTGTGAVIGGVLGAVVGNQFGSGNGRAAMTVVGGAGGALAGNNVERNVNKRVVGYRVSVQLDNGQSRVFEESQIGNLRVGDRVRVDGQHVRRG